MVWREDRVLLVRRARPPRAGSWSLPGGLLELGETAQDAARREVAEETGIAVRLLGLIDVVDLVRRDEAGRVRRHYTLLDYAAEWARGELRAGSDAAEAAWFPLAGLEDLDLWSETVRIIRRSGNGGVGTTSEAVRDAAGAGNRPARFRQDAFALPRLAGWTEPYPFISTPPTWIFGDPTGYWMP